MSRQQESFQVRSDKVSLQGLTCELPGMIHGQHICLERETLGLFIFTVFLDT